MKLKSHLIALLLSGLFLLVSILAISQDVLSPQELLKLESMSGLLVNPVKDELIFQFQPPGVPTMLRVDPTPSTSGPRFWTGYPYRCSWGK